ncbi:MAG: sigma-70 family RNA polymerase sigma factor [Anaerolineae bacterium]|nr:sigma-70 family RNA polymerase sigma factor [Anaerolineae bacterium]
METRHESDEALVKRLLPSTNNNPEDRANAWAEWYANTGAASVLAFVRTKNTTPVPDGDILQEAMLTAFTEVERGRYQPRMGIPFAAYVKGIARNKIREARRRTRRFIPLEETSHHLFESDQLCPEAVVERREQQVSFHMGLAKLPPCRRRVLEGYLKGHSTIEIADALGMSAESVRQHKSRGVRSLKQELRA